MELKTKFLTGLLILSTILASYSQKKLKKPVNRVGISSVDSLVIKSFDMYDQVYLYKELVDSGTELNASESDVVEYLLEESEDLLEYAMDATSDIEGKSVFKQGKAVLQINRAKKAIRYCLDTCKELLIEPENSESE